MASGLQLRQVHCMQSSSWLSQLNNVSATCLVLAIVAEIDTSAVILLIALIHTSIAVSTDDV